MGKIIGQQYKKSLFYVTFYVKLKIIFAKLTTTNKMDKNQKVSSRAK